MVAPKPFTASMEGLLVNGLASVINAGWCWMLTHQGRRSRPPALVADGKHLLTDVGCSVGVLLGVLLAEVTGWAILDPALAALVAVNILWSGWGVMRESVGGLMDEARCGLWRRIGLERPNSAAIAPPFGHLLDRYRGAKGVCGAPRDESVSGARHLNKFTTR